MSCKSLDSMLIYGRHQDLTEKYHRSVKEMLTALSQPGAPCCVISSKNFSNLQVVHGFVQIFNMLLDSCSNMTIMFILA